jgi:chemotaxis signal transduction protein
MLPLISPARPLGVAPATAAAMLVLRDGARRVGLAIDDVDDVHTADLGELRPPPDGDVDGVVLAIARRGGDLVSVIDPLLLLAACMAESRPLETDA